MKFDGKITEVTYAVEGLPPVELRALQIELMSALTAVCYEIERKRRYAYNSGKTLHPGNDGKNSPDSVGLPEGNHSS